MRALLLALCLIGLVAVVAPVAEASGPGGGCSVQEEYVTHASIGRDPDTRLPTVQPGARSPIACYY